MLGYFFETQSRTFCLGEFCLGDFMWGTLSKGSVQWIWPNFACQENHLCKFWCRKKWVVWDISSSVKVWDLPLKWLATLTTVLRYCTACDIYPCADIHPYYQEKSSRTFDYKVQCRSSLTPLSHHQIKTQEGIWRQTVSVQKLNHLQDFWTLTFLTWSEFGGYNLSTIVT